MLKMKPENNKNNAKNIPKAIITAYALLSSYSEPVSYAEYGRGLVFYIKESLFEIFDVKNFLFFIVAIVLGFFYYDLSKRQFAKKGSVCLAAFFACIIVFGEGFKYSGDFTLTLGSLANTVKTIVKVVGFTALFEGLLRYTILGLDKLADSDKPLTGFWKDKVFIKTLLIIMASYMPFMILSFPGNMCWDAEGQIEQVANGAGFSLHHPIVDTLFMGGIVKLGGMIFGTYNAGIFMYVMVQLLLMAAAFAFSLKFLAEKEAPVQLLRAILIFCCICPAFSNFGTTALKDMPFSAFCLFFMIMLAKCLGSEKAISKKTWIIFGLTQMLVIMFRNNGLPMIVLADIGIVVFLITGAGRSDKQNRTDKTAVKSLTKSFILTSATAIVLSVLITSLISAGLGAVKGSKGEILSLPFQQTARYLHFYPGDVKPAETAAIEALLGDTETIARVYDYTTADPVKAYFNKESSTADIARYMGVWIKMFFRHPGVYFTAFFAHVYGWFDPAVDNFIRYEVPYELTMFERHEIIPDIDRQLTAFYMTEDMISPLSLMQNIGMAVWALFILALYQKRTFKDKKYRVINLPLWIALLICMASPIFFGHPRYAFPILFSVPFLYGFTLSEKRAGKDF